MKTYPSSLWFVMSYVPYLAISNDLYLCYIIFIIEIIENQDFYVKLIMMSQNT